jgi:hypothetical protein
MVRGWLVVWLLFTIPLALLALLSQDYERFWLWWGQCLVALLAHFLLVIKPGYLVRMLLGFLAAAAFLATWGYFYGAYGFQREDRFWFSIRDFRFGFGRSLEREGFQLWRVEPGHLSWSVEARLLEGLTDWDWGRSHPQFELERLEDAGGVFTRVQAPLAPAANPHISRNYAFDKSIEGRTFKLVLEYRAAAMPALEPVYLMVSGGGQVPLELQQNWQTLERQWTAAGDTQRLRIILEQLNGHHFDVRSPRLWELVDGEWLDLGQGIGTGLRLRAENPGLPVIFEDFNPSANWQRYTLDISGETLDLQVPLVTKLVLGEGLRLRLRESRLEHSQGGQVRRIRHDVRQKLWFPDENLAGHSITAMGLVFLTTVQAPFAALGGFLLMLIAVLLTGSRAAFIVACLGGGALLLIKLTHKQYLKPEQYRVLLLLAILCGAALIAIKPQFIDLRVLSLAQEVRRIDIWRTAASALWSYPFGIPEYDFAGFFQSQYPDAPRIGHAHNFWLALAVNHGVVGLLAGLFLSTALTASLWRWGRWPGLILALSFLSLQFFDFTLFFSSVLLPLILGINSFKLNRRSSGQA